MKNIKIMYLQGFLGNFYLERAIWIVYLTTSGMSLGKVGFLQAILNGTMFLMEFPTGVITDRIGRKKSLMLGHSFIILYFLIFIVTKDFYLLAIGHVVYGIGLTFISGTDQTIIYEELKESSKEDLFTKIFGRYNALISIALAISMLLGGVIQNFSWKLVFGTNIIAHLIVFMFLMFLKESHQKETISPSIKGLIKNTFSNINLSSDFKKILVAYVIFDGVMSVFYMYNQDSFQSIGIRTFYISLIFAIESLLSSFVVLYVYKLENRFSQKVLIMTTMLSIASAFVVLSFNSHFTTIFVFFFVSLSSYFIAPIFSGLLNQHIPSETRASILSFANLLSTFIMFILFPTIGYLREFFSANQIWGVTGVLSVTLIILFLFLYYKEQPNTDTDYKSA